MSTRLIDNAVLDVKDSVIFRLATAAELEEANFFVFRPDEGHTLFSVNGVVFTKGGTENPQEPQKFNTATAPPEAEPLLHIARISPVRRTRGGIDPPSASLGPRSRRGRGRGRGRAQRAQRGRGRARGRPRGRGRGKGRGRAPVRRQQQVPEQETRAGSETSEEGGSGGEISSSDPDPMTDQDSSESESSHEEETIKWNAPAKWPETKRKHPNLIPFGEAVWTVPAERGSLPDIVTQPPRAETFNIQPEGTTPLIDMYLDAFPLAYWEEMAEQTKLYARPQEGDEDYSGRGRRWRPEICTPTNMLRLVAAALMRGLTNCTDNKEFFRGVVYKSQSTEFL